MLLCILDGESDRVKSDNADQFENHLVLQKTSARIPIMWLLVSSLY